MNIEETKKVANVIKTWTEQQPGWAELTRDEKLLVIGCLIGYVIKEEEQA